METAQTRWVQAIGSCSSGKKGMTTAISKKADLRSARGGLEGGLWFRSAGCVIDYFIYFSS